MQKRLSLFFEPVIGLRQGYWPALDGLRAIAVLGVLGRHSGSRLALGGDVGVDVFFVLSGFLITTILLKEHDAAGRIDLPVFYLRRALRLFPALIVVVVVCVALVMIPGFPLRAETLRDAPYSVVYVANWLQALTHPASGLLSHTWSLSVEEQFYLCWPLILIIVMRLGGARRTRYIVGATFALILASAVTRARLWNSTTLLDARFARVYFGSDTRADELLAGCLGGVLLVRVRAWPSRVLAALRWAGVAAAAVTALILTRAVVPYSVLMDGGETLLVLGIASLLLTLCISPVRWLERGLSFGPLVWVGRISYGTYLWSTPVELLIHAARPHWSSGPILLTAVPLALGLAALSFLTVERYFLRLRTQFRRGGLVESRPLGG